MPSTFFQDIAHNPANAAILARWSELALPDAWLVAGCLFQTVWNLRTGRPPGAGIKDHDLFYFDPYDLSEAGERKVQAHADRVLADLGITVEVANQARVHLWYPSHFGHSYAPLRSSEEGIARFLVLETCVAVRPGEHHAPYGLEGVDRGTLTPNPLVPFTELFDRKAASYRARWPHLRVTKGAPPANEDANAPVGTDTQTRIA